MDELTLAQQEQLRQQLLHLRRELLDTQVAQEHSSATVSLDQQAVGRVSRVDALQQQQMELAKLRQVKAHIDAVEHALHRLHQGDYGFCDDCGEPIGLPRLQVRPEAAHCIVCQSKHEASA